MSATISEVRERPILFSGEMVRAILDGRKTQTRRVVSNATSQGNWKASELELGAAWVDPGPSPAGNPGPYLKANPTREAMRVHGWPESDYGHVTDRLYPRWFPGDRLWVRESHYVWSAGYTDGTGQHVVYRATEPDAPNTWTPSIHMPRFASRITLEITGIRVERVQDISEADAKAEGVERCAAPEDQTPDDALLNVECGYFAARSYAEGYRALWDELNAKRGYEWDANPWVWVIEFRRVSLPGDERP